MLNRVEGKELINIITACLGKYKVYNAWEAPLTTKKVGFLSLKYLNYKIHMHRTNNFKNVISNWDVIDIYQFQV